MALPNWLNNVADSYKRNGKNIIALLKQRIEHGRFWWYRRGEKISERVEMAKK